MVLYRDETGRQRSAGSYTSEAEAKRVKRGLHDGDDRPKPKSYSTKALGTVAWTWLAGHQIEESTEHAYASVLKTWILPYLGEKPVSRITKADIRSFVKWMQGNGAGVPTIHKAHICLSALFSVSPRNWLMDGH
jgi:hypothetical protein